jgi:PIN domain nuclease of toxin-antitoxin system
VKLLLDTQCWLWWFAQPESLNEVAIAHIADETNELWLSVASVWEIGILRIKHFRIITRSLSTITISLPTISQS